MPKIQKEEPQHSREVAFVLKLAKQHRQRAAGSWMDHNGREGGWVEFRSSQHHAADRLTLEDLTALGFTVEKQSYGFILRAEGDTIIATSWPIDEWGRVSQRTSERIRDAGGAAGTRAGAATGTPGEDAGTTSDEQLQAPYASTVVSIPDARRTYTGVAVDNVRLPVRDDLLVRHFIKASEAIVQVMNRGERASQYGHVSVPAHEIEPLMMAQGFLGQSISSGLRDHDPCLCGSGGKYKRCHGRSFDLVSGHSL